MTTLHAVETVEPEPAPPEPPAPRPRRRTRMFGAEDWVGLGGSVLSSFALVTIGYEHILDFSGLVGFLVCWYLVFMALYGTVTAVAHPRTIVVDRLVAVTLYLAAPPVRPTPPWSSWTA